MKTLKGDSCYLRALEPQDLHLLAAVENNEEFWELSSTQTPFSEFTLKEYLANAHRDIYDVKQLRMAICTQGGDAIGFVDLFDFDPKNRRIGLGILIEKEEHRGKGYGSECIRLLLHYCFKHLHVHQVYANILEDNVASLALFERLGFRRAGIKKDWVFSGKAYKNEYLYQYLY